MARTLLQKGPATLTLPDTIVSALEPFSTLFRHSTWMKAQRLLVGAILSPRKRTVTSALRAVGLSDEAGFAKYHHVLSRAVWSPLQLNRVLLLLLIRHLAKEDEPLVFGTDETLVKGGGICGAGLSTTPYPPLEFYSQGEPMIRLQVEGELQREGS